MYPFPVSVEFTCMLAGDSMCIATVVRVSASVVRISVLFGDEQNTRLMLFSHLVEEVLRGLAPCKFICINLVIFFP